MLFATTSLGARIEGAECALLRDSAAAAARRRPADGVFAMPLAGGIATYTGPGSPLNKVVGLGFDGPLAATALDAVERAYAERGSPVQVEVATLADPAIVQALTARGYRLQGFENVLGRPLAPGGAPAPVPGVEVAVSPVEELERWVDLVVTGFATADTQGVPSHETFPRDLLTGVMADMASGEGFCRYVALRSGAAAGGASMRIGDGVAILCGAATLPEHRRRGVQTALLAERLRAAAGAGCDVAVVTTQPGSKSQENVQRQGFALLYARAVLVRTP